MKDAFSKCHPAVDFIFFLGAIVLSVVIQHPVYLLVGALTGAVYYLLLWGKKGWKLLLGLLPLFVILTAINPLFNTQGSTVLCYVFKRPYTLEALLYGGALSSMLVIMLLWFGCYNKVMTSDKFTSLFGSVIPSLSLLLVMVLRLIPNFMKKTRQITAARKSIGMGSEGKLKNGAAVLGAMTTWALEGSVVTGDSMRSRGYGTTKRTSFMIYRMNAGQWVLLSVVAALLGLSITALALGQGAADFGQAVSFAPVSWGLAAYSCYLMIPVFLHLKEVIAWHISKSKI